jgi:hypothetical protein
MTNLKVDGLLQAEILKQIALKDAEIERLRSALIAIAAYDPGVFRPLVDEVAIWKLATDALGEGAHEPCPPLPPNCICKPFKTELGSAPGWYLTHMDCPVHGSNVSRT